MRIFKVSEILKREKGRLGNFYDNFYQTEQFLKEKNGSKIKKAKLTFWKNKNYQSLSLAILLESRRSCYNNNNNTFTYTARILSFFKKKKKYLLYQLG